MKEITTNLLIAMGDTHGNWGACIETLQEYYIRDAVVLHVGDVGIGFLPKETQEDILESLNHELAERNVRMFCIRGNHDDPQYFSGEYEYSNIVLLADYSKMLINGKKFLFVGGAISIDRIMRTPNKSWWSDEVFVLDESRAEKCDVLITHTAPNWIGPIDKIGIGWYTERDPNLWEECCAERLTMNRLIEITEPDQHFCGHFHRSESAVNDKCISRILNENEICEIIL
jgi:Icc-related predicted phosphoesterase